MARYKKADPKLSQATFTLKMRELCTNQCQYYLKCPYAAYHDVAKRENKCRVVELSKEEQKRFINMFVFDEEDGLKNEALGTLWSLGKALDLKDDPREMKMYLEAVVNVARAFKKQEKKVEKKVEPIEINMSTLNPKAVGKEIIPIPVKNEDNDPQSLLNSKNLEGILAKRDGKVRKRDENWGR